MLEDVPPPEGPSGGDGARWTGGPLVEQHRRRIGMTWRQLAQDTGLSKSYLFKLVRDPDANPGIVTLMRVAHALGVPVNALTGQRAGDDYAAGWADAIRQVRSMNENLAEQLQQLLDQARPPEEPTT